MPRYRSTFRRRHATQFGFTIIELMITVAILAIMIGVGAPALRDFVIRSRLVTQASDLTVALQTARSEANRRSQRVMVCKASSTYSACATGTDWGAGWIVFVDSDRNGSFTTGEEILRVHQASPTNITITMAGGGSGSDRLYYRPTGPVDNAHTFTVCQTGYMGRVVTVGVTGRTSVAATTSVC